MSELYYSLVFTSSSLFILTLYSDSTEPDKLQLNYDTLMDMSSDNLKSQLKDYPASISHIVEKIREILMANKDKLAKIAEKLDNVSNKKLQLSADTIKNDLSDIVKSIQAYKKEWTTWYQGKEYKPSQEVANMTNSFFETISLKGILEKVQKNYPELYDSVNVLQNELNNVIQSQLKIILHQNLELEELKTELKTFGNIEDFKKKVDKTLKKIDENAKPDEFNAENVKLLNDSLNTTKEKIDNLITKLQNSIVEKNEKIKKLTDQLDEKENKGTSTTTDSAEITNLKTERTNLTNQVTNLTAQLAAATKQTSGTPQQLPTTPPEPQKLSEEDDKKIKTLENDKIELSKQLKDVREKIEQIQVSPENEDEINKLRIDETIYLNRINDLSIEIENIKNTQLSPNEKTFITVAQNDKKQLYLQIENLRQSLENLNKEKKKGEKKLSNGVKTCKDHYDAFKVPFNNIRKIDVIIKQIEDILKKNVISLADINFKDEELEKIKNVIQDTKAILNYKDLNLKENDIKSLKEDDSTELPAICTNIFEIYKTWLEKSKEINLEDLLKTFDDLYRALFNKYEDNSGAVRVYVRIKKYIPKDDEEKEVLITDPKKDSKEKDFVIDVEKNVINMMKCTIKIPDPTDPKNKSKLIEKDISLGKESSFYKIADTDWRTIDLFTGQTGSKTIEEEKGKENSTKDDKYLVSSPINATKNGLYNTFKQVEDGYSIILFGYGLSGSGKCHGKGTEILMYDGSIKKVEDVQVGDLLMGDDSTPRKVLSLARGRDKMYEVCNTKGDTYVVNSEHILTLKYSCKKYLRDRKDRFTYQVCYFDKQTLGIKSKQFSYKNKDKIEVYDIAKRYLDEIQDNLIVDIPLQKYIQVSKGYKSKLHGFKVPVDFEEKPLELDPYMLGVWLGDGHQNTCCITNQDASILKYFRDNLPKYNCYLSFQNSSNYTYRICSNDKLKHHETTNYFTIQLQQNNLINNKHIPMMYKCNSRENRLKLLAGILDSDGHLSKNGGYEIYQSIKHEKLMDDIVYLCRSLGFSCYKNIKKTSWTHNGEVKQGEAIRIHINGIGIEEIPVLCNRKKSNVRQQIKDPLVSSIQIKELQEDDYYGFELDGNHRYVLGNFIVTHNTFTLIGNADNPGILYYGLANLSNVKSITVQHIFEHYKADKIDLTEVKKSFFGNFISLFNSKQFLDNTKLVKDEETNFRNSQSEKYETIDFKDNYQKINELMNAITDYRKKIKDPRIKKTPNNPESSRSHLFIVFKVEFNNNVVGYVTIVDMAGKESPPTILRIETTNNPDIASSLVSPSFILSKKSLEQIPDLDNNTINSLASFKNITDRNVDKTYVKNKKVYQDREKQVQILVEEGLFINESLNHLRYFLSEKTVEKGKKVPDPPKVEGTISTNMYDPDLCFKTPSEKSNREDILMYPILEKLDKLGKGPGDEKPTKFVMVNAIRLEKKYCEDSLSTIKFVDTIKSSIDAKT